MMETDLSHKEEKAQIFLNGVSFGYCDGGNNGDGDCGWFGCTSQLANNQITSSSASVQVRLEYTSEVSSTYGTCTDSVTGEYGGGVAKIVLTPKGNMKIFSNSVITSVAGFTRYK